MYRVVPEDLLNNYKIIAERLIDEKKINENNHSTILKAALFLNRPHWHEYHLSTIRKLLCILKTHVHKLSNKEIIELFKVIFILSSFACL